MKRGGKACTFAHKGEETKDDAERPHQAVVVASPGCSDFKGSAKPRDPRRARTDGRDAGKTSEVETTYGRASSAGRARKAERNPKKHRVVYPGRESDDKAIYSAGRKDFKWGRTDHTDDGLMPGAVGNILPDRPQPLHRRRRRRRRPLPSSLPVLPPARLCLDPALRRVVIYSSLFSTHFHVCQSLLIVFPPAVHIWLSERRKWRRKEQVLALASPTRVPHITDLNLSSVVIKVGMVGDSQIGKTSLMVKYVEGSFDEDYIQTLGTHFRS